MSPYPRLGPHTFFARFSVFFLPSKNRLRKRGGGRREGGKQGGEHTPATALTPKEILTI